MKRDAVAGTSIQWQDSARVRHNPSPRMWSSDHLPTEGCGAGSFKCELGVPRRKRYAHPTVFYRKRVLLPHVPTGPDLIL